MMRKSTRRGLIAARLLLPLVLWALATRPPPARAQDATPLEDALAQGLVTAEITASSAALGELALTLTPAAAPLVVAVPLGTRFVPDNAGLSEVISVAVVELPVDGPTTVDPLPVAALSPDREGPSPMSPAAYAPAGTAGEPVLELLGRAQPLLAANDQAAHLALWAAHLGRPVEEVNAGLNVPLGPEDVARAAELAAGAQPSPAEAAELSAATETSGGDSSSPPFSTPIAVPEGSGGSLPLGLVLGLGFVGLLALAFGMAYVAQRLSATPAEDDMDAPPPPNRGRGRDQQKKQNAPPPPPPPRDRPGDRPLDRLSTTPDDAEAGSFVGIDGPHSGRTLTIRGAAVLARSPIEIHILPLEGLSSPHVFLEWRGNAVEVKDLNSTNGTLINGEPPAGPGKQEARFGDQLTLPGGVVARLNLDGLEVDGRIIRKQADYLALSRDELEVVALGHDDMGISDPHCLIRRNGDEYTVRDLNSSNGVILNGVRVGAGEHTVPPDATLKLGHSTFRRAGGPGNRT